MSDRPLHIGIDLGTTNSVAVVYDGERLELVRNRQGGTLTPSVVRIDARGNVLVGERARRMVDTDPDNARGEFKRLMGTDQRIVFPASGKEHKPEELAAEVLRALRLDIADQVGLSPERAVISVPALFELPQISATSEAARLAGFAEIEVIQEPVASAIAAGWTETDSSQSWLVYDLGGGTFDASLLETREGMLRVVGHDGDNFLGGRDIDGAIVTHVLARLDADGRRIDRADPRHAKGLRRLRHAAEEAKLELAREREVAITVAAAFDLDGSPVDIEAWLDRTTLDALALPIVDRTLQVCKRLLRSRGLAPADLGHIVLVGGPTVMPVLRRRVAEVLGAPIAEGLDPMTLVARGAALFAATVGVDGRPRRADPAPAGPRVWLQHPAVTADLTPYVVGRVLEAGTVTGIRIERIDGGWSSPVVALDQAAAFATPVNLLARRANAFRIVGVAAGGSVTLHPAEFRIVHGLTVADPPLSRSIGVALADDSVQVYLDRGTPLPMRRTFTHRTVETVAKGALDFALNVPIVQGEVPVAHLCRLVGRIQIPGDALQATLPAGSAIEVTLQLDRSGRLGASAFVPVLQQTFEQVAWLIVPKLSIEALAEALADLTERIDHQHASSFARRDLGALERLEEARRLASEVAEAIDAARGGDADAGEKGRRAAIEIDGLLYELESEAAWPELADRIQHMTIQTAGWVARYGEPAERQSFTAMVERAQTLFDARKAGELERLFQQMRRLGDACYLRSPGAWEAELGYVASRISESFDLPRATRAVARGRAALERNDTVAVEAAVREIWSVLPPDVEERRLSHDSGVR